MDAHYCLCFHKYKDGPIWAVVWDFRTCCFVAEASHCTPHSLRLVAGLDPPPPRVTSQWCRGPVPYLSPLGAEDPSLVPLRVLSVAHLFTVKQTGNADLQSPAEQYNHVGKSLSVAGRHRPPPSYHRTRNSKHHQHQRQHRHQR